MSMPMPQPLPREYRVTGTVPHPARAVTPRKASAGIEPTLFWVTIAAHGVLIALEVYLAWKAKWI